MIDKQLLTNTLKTKQTVFAKLICSLSMSVIMSCGVAVNANANAQNTNSFGDDFTLDLADYLGAEQTKEYQELYTRHKQQFNSDFMQALKAFGKKTQLTNGEVADTLSLLQPLMRQYVASLRSIQFEGTQPQQKYTLLSDELNNLQQAGLTLPNPVLTHFTEQGEQALFYQQSINACDTNANGMIDKTSREERRCVGDREVAQATKRAETATKRAEETGEQLKQATQRADAATQRADAATQRADAATRRADAAKQEAKESFERLVNSAD